MKYKSLFALATASLTMLFACEKPVDLGPEEVTIVSSDVPEEIPVDGGEYTVELKATLDWTVQDYEGEVTSWLSIKPSNGEASAENQTISIKVGQNTGANRSFDIVFYGNIMHEAVLTISQPGPEGDGESLTVAEFIEKADTQNEYVLTGVIGDIATSSKYWGFTLKDDTGTISCPFIGANADEFKAMDMHTGDSVSVKGVYEFYTQKSEHQLSDGTIVEYKALPSESIETVTVEQFITAADPFTMYRLTGEVSSSVNSQYCSFDLTDDSGTIVVWTVNNASEYGSTLKQGDKVTLRGAYTWYENTENPSSSKHEVVDATIEAVEPGQGGGEIGTPAGSGTAEDPFNVAAAYKFIDDGGYNSPALSPEVYVKGTISSIEEVDTGDFGNATYCITDGDGSAELTVFRGYYLNGDKFTSADQIKIGYEVVVVGQLTNYNGTYEFNSKNRIYSINGEGGGEDPGSGDEPTSADKVTIEQFLDKDVNTTDWYELTGTIVNIGSSANDQSYGNFTMSDDSGSVYVYGLVKAWAGGSNDQSFSQIGLEVGDIVTIWTLRSEHNGSPQGGGSIPAIYKSHEDGAPVTYPEGTVSLTFPDDNQANNKVNGYDEPWTAMSGDYSFTMTAFNNYEWKNWSYVRCGRKTASVASIATDDALPKLASVEVLVDNVIPSDVNSVSLSIYSDSGRTELVNTVNLAGDLQVGINEFAIDSQYQAEGQYYVLTFDCAASSQNKNGFVQISKVTYVAAE